MPTFLTAALLLGCGYSDYVYDYILETMPVKSEKQYAFPGKQGETGRRLYMYPDGSWFLTLEYLSKGEITDDKSCIVAVGPREEIEKALDLKVNEHPAAAIGEPVELPELE